MTSQKHWMKSSFMSRKPPWHKTTSHNKTQCRLSKQPALHNTSECVLMRGVRTPAPTRTKVIDLHHCRGRPPGRPGWKWLQNKWLSANPHRCGSTWSFPWGKGDRLRWMRGGRMFRCQQASGESPSSVTDFLFRTRNFCKIFGKNFYDFSCFSFDKISDIFLC